LKICAIIQRAIMSIASLSDYSSAVLPLGSSAGSTPSTNEPSAPETSGAVLGGLDSLEISEEGRQLVHENAAQAEEAAGLPASAPAQRMIPVKLKLLVLKPDSGEGRRIPFGGFTWRPWSEREIDRLMEHFKDGRKVFSVMHEDVEYLIPLDASTGVGSAQEALEGVIRETGLGLEHAVAEGGSTVPEESFDVEKELFRAILDANRRGKAVVSYIIVGHHRERLVMDPANVLAAVQEMKRLGSGIASGIRVYLPDPISSRLPGLI
jgi:hypothetical protein